MENGENVTTVVQDSTVPIELHCFCSMDSEYHRLIVGDLLKPN